jgi:hypothetical protein
MCLSILLALHDSAPNLPIAGRDKAIDTACDSATSHLQQCNDVGMDGGVIGLLWNL